MKTRIALLFLIAVCPMALCQNQTEPAPQVSDRITHELGDLSFSGSPDILFNTPNGTQFAGGLKMRIFMGKRVSFDADLVIGKDYVHGGLGLIGIPIWILFLGSGLSTDEDAPISDFLIKLGAMVLSVEHTAYHFPVSKKTDLSPYLSLLRIKQTYEYGNPDDPDFTYAQFCFATGLELNKYYKRFLLSPYVEFQIGYTDHRPGVNAGVYCGIFLPNKKR